MVREYVIDDTRENLYTMAYAVSVKMTDKRYGAETVKIAQFNNEDDAQIFIDARLAIEKKAE